uniref:Uncharacterized protein n=1 Tax=Bradyrhizobium diazoefficiens TaxID=1355477 RepID=A0A809Y1C4_9BRAD|nr:hypothetical protein XF2B_78510 [Bradyrhizobium diazoefficiens]BCF21160.1 hypothetical protein XF13B_78510 [Bradyrhizobium diazoefficiens]
MLIGIQIGGRVEQSDLLHQARLCVAQSLIMETLIQRGRARLDVLGFRVLEHTLQERDTSDVIARRLGDGVGSSTILGISIDEIDEAAASRAIGRNALGK